MLIEGSTDTYTSVFGTGRIKAAVYMYVCIATQLWDVPVSLPVLEETVPTPEPLYPSTIIEHKSTVFLSHGKLLTPSSFRVK